MYIERPDSWYEPDAEEEQPYTDYELAEMYDEYMKNQEEETCG